MNSGDKRHTSDDRPAPDRAPVKRFAKIRLRVGYVYLMCAVIFAQPEFHWVITGIILIVAGAAIRLIASATLIKDKKLCTSGIYSVTRNPLYLGSACVGLGFAALTSLVWFPIIFLIVLVPLHMRMITLEEIYLEKLHPETYPAYKKAVPVFLPRPWPPARLSGTLDGNRLRKSGEPVSTALFAIPAIILLAWHQSWLQILR